MAWTEPKTWLSEPLTAQKLNEQLRDNLAALKRPASVALTDPYTAQNVTSTTYVDLTGTHITITTEGGDLIVGAHGFSSVSTAFSVYLGVYVNGLVQTVCFNRTADHTSFGGVVVFDNLSPGTYQVRMQGKIDNTGTGRVGVIYFWAREIS